jgi:hypothetical protein
VPGSSQSPQAGVGGAARGLGHDLYTISFGSAGKMGGGWNGPSPGSEFDLAAER